ncbi:hypothetical protein EDM53_04880, partial [Rickettsiales endosymbiont of Peranema trichophorum]|uniref:PD-(D/E)XK nuclease domain-containing protein n=1 Tax=Rickettsiales endosymbiont of Peranema trichophorum TaxID=2486577 RepID=UPI0010F0C7C0
DVEKFKLYISSYIIQSGSYFDFNKNTPEQVFHVFILGLVVGLRGEYDIQSNKEAGLGRCDVALIPKDITRAAILLEFKISDNLETLHEKAEEALKQIKERQYIEMCKQKGVKEVLAIGLAFCGKHMELVYDTVVSFGD